MIEEEKHSSVILNLKLTLDEVVPPKCVSFKFMPLQTTLLKIKFQRNITHRKATRTSRLRFSQTTRSIPQNLLSLLLDLLFGGS